MVCPSLKKAGFGFTDAVLWDWGVGAFAFSKRWKRLLLPKQVFIIDANMSGLHISATLVAMLGSLSGPEPLLPFCFSMDWKQHFLEIPEKPEFGSHCSRPVKSYYST